MNNLDAMLQRAVQCARAGLLQEARQLVWQVVSTEPHHEQAWSLLAYVAQTVEERRAALWKILSFNPNHPKARQAFLRSMDEGFIQQAAQKGIFISYAHADQLFVLELANDLRLLGVDVWLDILDMSEESDWNEAIEEALKRCGLMLVVASPAALRADNVMTEVRRFMDSGKIVLPVQSQPTDLTAIGLWNPSVDFTTDYGSGLQDLVRVLGVPEPAYHGRA
ncbi:MAG: TIR domain-containing protein [Anaerolineae bacterium]|nr:TIR domain-containing protein [Anaerolineae bacterium]